MQIITKEEILAQSVGIAAASIRFRIAWRAFLWHAAEIIGVVLDARNL